MWKRTISGSPDPPKPPQGPPGPPGGPRSLKMAQIINNQSSGDDRSKKINFWEGSIFFSFFTRNDPLDFPQGGNPWGKSKVMRYFSHFSHLSFSLKISRSLANFAPSLVCAIGGLQKCPKFACTGDTFQGCWLLWILMMVHLKSMVSSSYNHCYVQQ